MVFSPFFNNSRTSKKLSLSRIFVELTRHVAADEEDQTSHAKLITGRDRSWRKMQDCYNMIPESPDKLTQFKVRFSEIHEVRNKV